MCDNHFFPRFSSMGVTPNLTTVLDKVIKNGPNKICGTQLFKYLQEYGLL